jgi:glycosyltransferase involved in cell wall biosynthesis
MLRAGDFEGAEKMLKERLKTDSGNYKLLNTLGDISRSKNDFYSARIYYSLAKKNCGDFKEIERLSDVISNLEPAVTDIRNNKKLVILDDYFPNVKTGFRVAEYNYYLNKYPNCEIYSLNSNFHNNLREYESCFPQFKNRVKQFDANDCANYNCSLFYTVFISNAYNFLPVFEMNNTPFVFELYPGGRLGLNDPVSDRMLFTVCKSPLLKKILVTQKITFDYIIEKGYAAKDKVELVYGAVTDSKYFEMNHVNKKYFKNDKDTFDICFVGRKYISRGTDKGYDTFIEVCRILSRYQNNMRFHVVGDFDEREIDVSDFKDRITFYGLRNIDFFPAFHSGMDIILSPNKPFLLHQGNFDGFPLGCWTDAGLNGVGILCTDPLKQNMIFEDGRDICIIRPDVNEIIEKINYYYNNLDKLYEMSANGCKILKELYDIENQMSKRIDVLDRYL